MKINPLDAEQRKIFINSSQLYQEFIKEMKRANQFQGGLHWKLSGGHSYLFKTRGGRGLGKSLGRRSEKTEMIFSHFHEGKIRSKERIGNLKQSLVRQSKLSIAVGINRMPKTPAQILRLLEQEGVLGKGVTVLGTHALYAYEAAAGVMIENDLMETLDIDLLYRSGQTLKLSTEFESVGLIGLLKKVDKSFEVVKGHYRAINSKGFMVELIKKSPKPPFKEESRSLSGNSLDLQAAELDALEWLSHAPSFCKTAIAEDGIPVNLVVPDPRFFALNKFWLSQKEDREPIKRPRDYGQAVVIAEIALNYLNLPFDDAILQVFPVSIRDRLPELLKAIENMGQSLENESLELFSPENW